MSFVYFQIFDITQNGRKQIIEHQLGQGNFLKMKIQLARQRNISNVNDIVLKTTDGIEITNEESLRNDQMYILDCPNPIQKKIITLSQQNKIIEQSYNVKIKGKEVLLDVQSLITDFPIQQSTEKRRNFKKENLVVEQKIQLKQQCQQQDIVISQIIDDFEEEDNHKESIAKAKQFLEMSQLAFSHFGQLTLEQDILNLLEEFHQKKEENNQAIQQIDEQIPEQLELTKQAEEYQIYQILETIKSLEQQKKKKIDYQKEQEQYFIEQREERTRFKYFNRQKQILQELKIIEYNNKLQNDIEFQEECYKFKGKINKLEEQCLHDFFEIKNKRKIQ